MATQITNQAQISFAYGSQYGTATSNIATTTIQGPLTVGKTSLESTYRSGDIVTYILTTSYTSTSVLNVFTLVDLLGSYLTVGSSAYVTPLTYTGAAQLYINGIYMSGINPSVTANSITFVINALPANANAIIIYNARINNSAALNTGSYITNTATWTATNMSDNMYDINTIAVADYADVRIFKSMSPNPVTDGSHLTYTFTLYNYGNVAATYVVLSDTFHPAPNPITVTVNGLTIGSEDFSYSNSTLRLPADGSSLSVNVPEATFTQDPVTGEIAVVPGITVITVMGTL